MRICGFHLFPNIVPAVAVSVVLGALGISGCGTGNNAYSPIVKNSGGPGFTVAVSPASVSTSQGGTANYTVSITETGGFNSPITLTASGLPADATATFGTLTATATGATATLAISTGSEDEGVVIANKLAKPASASKQVSPTGSTTFTITATGGGITQSATATLVVSSAPDFSIAITPASVSVQSGKTANYTVTLTSIGGLAVSGATFGTTLALPSTAVATFGTPTATSTGETVPLTIATTGTDAGPVPAGSYTVTVIGTVGGQSHSASSNLVVTASMAANFTVALTPRANASKFQEPVPGS